MSDTFTEVTSEGWFSRIMSSIKGVLFGIFLFIAGVPLLFWNEGRAVTTYRSLNEGLAAVVSIDAAKVEAANDKKLVHLTGEAKTTGNLRDEKFGIDVPNGLKLKRKVEMYQWDEDVDTKTEKSVGGKKTTKKTYSYRKVWKEGRINSGNFQRKSGHENPNPEFQSDSWSTSSASLGAFQLSSTLIGKLSNWTNVPATDKTKSMVGISLQRRLSLDGEKYYLGRGSASSPSVGDLRISFKAVKPHTVSVVAQQVGKSFQAYQTQAGDKLEMLSAGSKTAKEMFDAAQAANTIMTWVIRLIGFFIMWLGVKLVFEPLVVVADVIPFFGNILGTGTSLFALLIAGPSAFLVIAFAWFAYRPLLSICLLAGAVGIVVFCMKMAKGGGGGGGAKPPPVPPPMPGGGAQPPPIPGQ